VGNVPVQDLSQLLQHLADARASRDVYRELLQHALGQLHGLTRRVAALETRNRTLTDQIGPPTVGQARRAA
jgi:hypothetical protein